MKTTITILWAILPIVGAALWFGPAEPLRSHDAAVECIERGERAFAEERWDDATESFAVALDLLPTDAVLERDRVRLDHAEALIQAGDMVGGQETLSDLLETTDDPALREAARHALATASYHAAWLMRVEGATPEEWKIESERARRHFRLLAETSSGDEQLAFSKNLEATIRLEQMDLGDLRALPLPKNCSCNCNGLSQRKRFQQESRGKKRPKDAREDVEKQGQASLNTFEGGGS